MATTAMIVEIVVIGVVSATWICLLLIRTSPLGPAQLCDVMSGLSEWATATAIVATAFVYQLGWIMNGVCHGITTVICGRWLRDKEFREAGLPYRKVRTAVYQRASADLRGDLGVDRTVTRLARAAAINFAILGGILLSMPTLPKSIGATVVCCAVAAAWQWADRHVRYYRRMVDAYNELEPDR